MTDNGRITDRRTFIRSMCAFTAMLNNPIISSGQKTFFEPDLTGIVEGNGWQVFNRRANLLNIESRKAVQFDERVDDGLALLEDYQFKDGMIDIDIKGKNALQQSFVGIALHVNDETTYDVIYFRPFNFRSDNPERRSHAVQYMSLPNYPWKKLRREHPGKYEQPVQPAPDPDGWFHARIIAARSKVSVFVNKSEHPCLFVRQLNEHKTGAIGIWVGANSGGAFVNLKISPI